MSPSKWHSLLCQEQPAQLHAAWGGVPGWSVFLLGLCKEFDDSGGSVDWTPRSVRGPIFSPSFTSGILSVSFACPGRSGAPESVSGPGMPFFKRFMV